MNETYQVATSKVTSKVYIIFFTAVSTTNNTVMLHGTNIEQAQGWEAWPYAGLSLLKA